MSYHFQGWWRWLWLSMIGIILLFTVYMALTLWLLSSGLNLTASDRSLFFALASLLVIMTLGLAGFMGLIYQQTFVRLDDQGISYHQPGLRLRASWQDVQHIGEVPFGRLRVKGLVLEHSELSGSPLMAWIVKRTGQDKVIPLTPFMANWQQELANYRAYHGLLEQAGS